MNTVENHAFAPLPAKRYFAVAEVCKLCDVKPHILRHWDEELSTLISAVRLRAPRRYYQHHEVQLLRRIRHLIYEEGYTLAGVRNQLAGSGAVAPEAHTAIRLSAAELQSIRHDLTQVKEALDEALAN